MIVNHHQKISQRVCENMVFMYKKTLNGEVCLINWPCGHILNLLTNRSSGKESGGMIPAPIKNPQKSLAALVSASFLLLALPSPT